MYVRCTELEHIIGDEIRPKMSILNHWPLGDVVKLVIFKLSHITERYPEHFLWNCPQVNATRPHYRLVNIGSGNGLMPSGTRPQWVMVNSNRLVSQMRVPLAACREPAGKLWQLCKVLYVFEHKMHYFLIHAPFTCTVVFWHVSIMAHRFRRVTFVLIPPCFV